MKEIVGKVGLLIGSLIVGLVLAEIALRIFYMEERKRSVTYDEDLGWGGRPFAEGVYFTQEDSTDAEYRFNELGFRDELLSSLSDSSIRVVLLGDSFVESLEVDYDSTFYRRVELMLKARVSKNIDVVNVSSQGYGTAQEILALEKFQDKIRPTSVILVFYTGNDFSDNARRRFALVDQQGDLQFNRQRDSWLRTRYSRFMSWLYDNSHLVYFVKNTLQTKLHIAWFSNPDATQVIDDSKEYEHRITELLLLYLKQTLEEKKIPFRIIIVPAKTEVIGRDPSRAAVIEQLCIDRRIIHLNLYGVLKPEHFLRIDTHFNVEGHRFVSEIVYEFLANRALSGGGL